jgi:hypothetical protein
MNRASHRGTRPQRLFAVAALSTVIGGAGGAIAFARATDAPADRYDGHARVVATAEARHQWPAHAHRGATSDLGSCAGIAGWMASEMDDDGWHHGARHH